MGRFLSSFVPAYGRNRLKLVQRVGLLNRTAGRTRKSPRVLSQRQWPFHLAPKSDDCGGILPLRRRSSPLGAVGACTSCIGFGLVISARGFLKFHGRADASSTCRKTQSSIA